MTPSPRTLTQMQRRATSYEVGMTFQGQTTSLGFTERTTKSVLLKIAAQNGEEITRMLDNWDGAATYTKATGWTFGPVRIHFTGRTERDIASTMSLV